ncbi:MAG: hypothetical protein GX442_00225 [Candidatus Riflebacteria bacterium]|nr:hypothetical protein [Candidatus Riflebacteria bacterium]
MAEILGSLKRDRTTLRPPPTRVKLRSIREGPSPQRFTILAAVLAMLLPALAATALEQFGNSGFTNTNASWTLQSRVSSQFAMETFTATPATFFEATYEGDAAQGTDWDTSDGLVWQTFPSTVPSGPFIASITLIHREVVAQSGAGIFNFTGTIRDAVASSQVFGNPFINEAISDGVALHSTFAAGVSSTAYLLEGGRTYRGQLYFSYLMKKQKTNSCFVDYFGCNVSPWGLTVSETANKPASATLDWSDSLTKTGLKPVANYKVWRDTLAWVQMASAKESEPLPAQEPQHLASRGKMSFPQEVERHTLANTGRCPGTIDRPLHFSKSPVGPLDRVGGRWEELFVEEEQSPLNGRSQELFEQSRQLLVSGNPLSQHMHSVKAKTLVKWRKLEG